MSKLIAQSLSLSKQGLTAGAVALGLMVAVMGVSVSNADVAGAAKHGNNGNNGGGNSSNHNNGHHNGNVGYGGVNINFGDIIGNNNVIIIVINYFVGK